jgi:competence protein ComEA
MKSIIDLCKNNKTVAAFLEEYGPQVRKTALICLIGLVLFAGFSLFQSADDELEVASSSEHTAKSEDNDTRTVSAGMIYVDVGGAVKTPMLAELPDGSRVDDAIKAAGGLKQEADMTSINRAEFLEDGQKVFIPSFPLDEDGNVIENAAVGAAVSNENPADSGNAPSSGKININTADSTALQTLSGVGPATAQKIIDYRQSNGRFSSVEDLKNVSGIGDKTYEKLKDSITI